MDMKEYGDFNVIKSTGKINKKKYYYFNTNAKSKDLKCKTNFYKMIQ